MHTRPYKLILGLGNPGKEYERTYHNAGALAVRSFAEASGAKLTRPKGKHFSFAKAGETVVAVPETFMNESGAAAAEALKFFGLQPEDLCVIHDDSDIELGKYKTSVGRGSAGHHGIDSIVGTLGTNAFTRIRVGIRPPDAPPEHRKKAGEFVLARISAKDRDALYGVFGTIRENVIEK